jgi:hydrogenase expression/formation protein HypC
VCLAVPGKIISIKEETGESILSRTGKVSFGGVVKEVSLAYVPEAKVGDYVIVHVGFAISIVDEEEAARTFEYLRQMEELGEESRDEEFQQISPHNLQPSTSETIRDEIC